MSIMEDCLYKSTSTIVLTSKVSEGKRLPIVNHIISFLIKNVETAVELYVGASLSIPWNFNVIVVDDVNAFM